MPLSPTFSSYNNLILRIFTCFIYVLQEITPNQANVAKRDEYGTKRRKAAKTDENRQNRGTTTVPPVKWHGEAVPHGTVVPPWHGGTVPHGTVVPPGVSSGFAISSIYAPSGVFGWGSLGGFFQAIFRVV